MAVFTSNIFALRKKMILEGLAKAGAWSPETAKTLAEAGLKNPDLFMEYTQKLVLLGILRRTSDGKYYLPGK